MRIDVSEPVAASMNFDSESKLPITRTASELSRIVRFVSVVLSGRTLKNDTFPSTLPLASRLPVTSI